MNVIESPRPIATRLENHDPETGIVLHKVSSGRDGVFRHYLSQGHLPDPR